MSFNGDGDAAGAGPGDAGYRNSGRGEGRVGGGGDRDSYRERDRERDRDSYRGGGDGISNRESKNYTDSGRYGADLRPDPNSAVSSTEVFVGGLHPSVTRDDFQSFFEQFGEVVKADLKEGKGFGFIGFATPEARELCMENRDTAILNGKKVDIKN